MYSRISGLSEDCRKIIIWQYCRQGCQIQLHVVDLVSGNAAQMRLHRPAIRYAMLYLTWVNGETNNENPAC
jgi:hypothetical protein